MIGAVRFFTRLPLPGPRGHSSAALERAMRYFSLAGLVVGAFAALTYTLAALFWPKTLAVLAAIALAILLTGALHEDGWCDMVDGFGGGASREVMDTAYYAHLAGIMAEMAGAVGRDDDARRYARLAADEP